MNKDNGFNQDEYIFVRGIPMKRTEVAMHQARLGAQLFDESMFVEFRKKMACASVIKQLDYSLRQYIEKHGRIGTDKIVTIDIGDPSWVYIPVLLFAPPEQSGIVMMSSKEKPVGLVGWFRMKKQYQTAKIQ